MLFDLGPVIGFGVTSAALCDVIYSVPEATFNTPFMQLGKEDRLFFFRSSAYDKSSTVTNPTEMFTDLPYLHHRLLC